MKFKGYLHDSFKAMGLDPIRWFLLVYKDGEVSIAIMFLKFKIQPQRSSDSTPWEKVINTKKGNSLLFFHDLSVVIQDKSV